MFVLFAPSFVDSMCILEKGGTIPLDEYEGFMQLHW